MRRRLIQLLLGCVLVTAAACLPVGPASAWTVAVTVTSGSADLYDEFGTYVDTLPLTGPTCSTPTSTLTVTGTSSGTLALDVNGDRLISSTWRLIYSIDVNGTYSGSAVSAQASIDADLVPVLGSCTPTGGSCNVVADSISMSGTLSGTAVSLSGDNAWLFATQVTGATCGAFSAVNNGHVDPLAFTVV